MMIAQTGTIADLVKANREYLAKGLLGAEQYPDCVYDYKPLCGTPHRCSIGAMMNDNTLANMHKHGANEGYSVSNIRGIGVLDFDSRESNLVAANTQRLHDWWAGEAHGPEAYRNRSVQNRLHKTMLVIGNANFEAQPDIVRSFLVQHKDDLPGKALFAEWIETVAEHYGVDKKAA